jgi:hypothetical protein
MIDPAAEICRQWEGGCMNQGLGEVQMITEKITNLFSYRSAPNNMSMQIYAVVVVVHCKQRCQKKHQMQIAHIDSNR